MWQMTNPWWETVLRAFVIYYSVFILFRLVGKKQLGKMSPFDIVLLLIVSESVSNGLTGGDQSLLTGLICAATLIGISYFMDLFAFKSKKFESLVDGKPQIIISNGIVQKKIKDWARITDEELENSIRDQGVDQLSQIKYAVLETNGHISVIKKDPAS